MSREDRPAGAEPSAAPDGRRLRWAEHRTARRAAFVQAGTTAIDGHGPNASAEQVAEAAGVSRTVLYRYFRDREDLRQAIADHVVESLLDDVLPQLQLSLESTPRKIISATIDVIIGWLDEHPNLYYFLRGRRNGSSLDSVEATLADRIAQLLKMILMFFGLEASEAEPGAYGIVGFVESSGAWWLEHRTMSRDAFSRMVCSGVWHLLEGVARDHKVDIGYDQALPTVTLTQEVL